MLNGTSPPTAQEPSHAREQLAERIGFLIARAWLRQQQAPPSRGSDPAPVSQPRQEPDDGQKVYYGLNEEKSQAYMQQLKF